MFLITRYIIQQQGFTFLELLIVLAILGLLAALLGPSIFPVGRGCGPGNTTSTRIAMLETALDTYRLDIFEYPKTLNALLQNETNDPRWQGPYLKKGLPDDFWGNPYQYQIPGSHGNEFDIYSYGADGKHGGKGENADIGNWTIELPTQK